MICIVYNGVAMPLRLMRDRAKERPQEVVVSEEDIKNLATANEAIKNTSPDARRLALEYLWDRWVTHPNHDDAAIEE